MNLSERAVSKCRMYLSALIFSLVGSVFFSASLHAGAFSYPNFSSTAGLNLVSSAAPVGNDIRLSVSAPNTAGAMWYTTKQYVQGGFESEFCFRVTSPGGNPDASLQGGGDGLAFVVQNTSNTAIGLTDSYMGYEIDNSLAAEFDTWLNPNFTALEPSINHVGVQSAGIATNSPFAGAYIGAANVVPDMSDGSVHTGKIRYVPGTLQVFVDDLVNPALTVSVNLSTLLNLSAGEAFVGFTGGGAGAYENHDILCWNFRTIPEPSSLTAMALGGLMMLTRRRSRAQ